MKMNEIKAGEIFCIDGTKTYPKLKLNVGCVDMRDHISQKCREAHIINFDYELMTEKEIEAEFKKYGMTMNDVENLKKELSLRFN